ncbi:MAG: aminotransferase [Clostridiales bacterium]|jgi:DNA-binding transcriptional MocR family regulator|nr:aminotransferase [Clostridiales bacterium]
MTKTQMAELKKNLLSQYQAFKAKGLKLDMSRGKPGAKQLDLSLSLLHFENIENDYMKGPDYRNYGLLEGIDEFRNLYAEILGYDPSDILVFGNSSLNVMYDYISQCVTHGSGGEPWLLQKDVKFICPVPGYDRHFAILEHFGIKMLNVPMKNDGPDMDLIEEHVKDPSVKGIFCVPQYSNPDGITYNADVVERLSRLKPAADDFRIIWDNAYNVHHLGEEQDSLPSILQECSKHGNQDLPIEILSTSKITFPGAGVALLAASKNNIEAIKKRMSIQTIGHDKLNQLRHANFIGDARGLKEHMKKHAEILAPKFELVLGILDEELSEFGIAQWNEPRGGYFISLNTMEGCAKRTVQLCKEAGATLTPAGATFPYGKDPKDSNIRLAPTFPPLEELGKAMELFCICVKLAALEKLMA